MFGLHRKAFSNTNKSSLCSTVEQINAPLCALHWPLKIFWVVARLIRVIQNTCREYNSAEHEFGALNRLAKELAINFWDSKLFRQKSQNIVVNHKKGANQTLTYTWRLNSRSKPLLIQASLALNSFCLQTSLRLIWSFLTFCSARDLLCAKKSVKSLIKRVT